MLRLPATNLLTNLKFSEHLLLFMLSGKRFKIPRYIFDCHSERNEVK